MVVHVSAALLLSCYASIVLASGSYSSGQCGVQGKWINDLGSNMTLTCQPDSSSSDVGSLDGRYNTAVGRADGYYKLSGRYARSGNGLKNCLVGFTVTYNNNVYGNSNSTASFTGSYFAVDDTIYTQWVLVRHTKQENMWLNSLLGHNVFNRAK